MALVSLVRFWRDRLSPRRRTRTNPRARIHVERLESRELLNAAGADDILPIGTNIDLPPPAPGILPTPTPTPTPDNSGGTPGITPPGTQPAPRPVNPVQDAIESRWLTRLYNDLLHRNPQGGEIAGWLDALRAGTTRSQVGQAFVASTEYQENLVRSQYRAYLGRDAEPGATAWWLGGMQAGMTDLGTAALFLASNEFYAAHGGTPRSWVTGLYGVTLGRAPDSAGLNAWAGAVQAGTPREMVAYAFLTSPEGSRWHVGDLFAGLLRREAGPDEHAFWAAHLRVDVTPSQLAGMLVATPEYGVDRIPTGPRSTALRVGTVAGPDGTAVRDGEATAATGLSLDGAAAPGLPVMALVDGIPTTRGRAGLDGALDITLSQALSNGSHRVAGLAIPGRGLSSGVQITVDGIAPSLALEAGDVLTGQDSTIDVVFNPNDTYGYSSVVTIDVDLDGDGSFDDPGEQGYAQGHASEGTSAVALQLPRGEFDVRLRGRDRAGNEGVSEPQRVSSDPYAGFIGSQVLRDVAALPEEQWNNPDNLYRKLLMVDDQGRIQINARTTQADRLNAFRADLEELGMQVTWVEPAQKLVIGYLPVEQINNLPSVPTFHSATPLLAPIRRAGLVAGQSVPVIAADRYSAAFGLTGAGVTVGVLSDSADLFGGGLAASQATGDLGPVAVLMDGPAGSSDEGRAMLEIIHDVAPGANLAFHTGAFSPQTMASGIRLLRQAGADVIVDDIGWPVTPWFNDGVIGQAINAVSRDGAFYALAFGNDSNNGWQDNWRGVTATVGGITGTFHDLGGGDVLQNFTLPAGGAMVLNFQWDAAWLEGGPINSNYLVPNDLAVVVTDATGQTLIGATNTVNQNTNEALEFAVIVNGGTAPANLAMSFQLVNGPAPNYLHWYNQVASGASNIFAQGQGSGAATTGNSMALLGVAVAASSYQTPTIPEGFTSIGAPTPLAFNDQGNRLGTAIIRNKPEITAPDDLNTTFFPAAPLAAVDTDNDGLPNFQGTSAAAPDLAAAVALVMQQAPWASARRILRHLQKTALDIAAPGYDYLTGAGLVQLTTPLVRRLESDLADDPLELNETSDAPRDFGALARRQQQYYAGLTINVRAGLPDYDWFRWVPLVDGVFTVTTNIEQENGDLELHVFQVQPNNVLAEIGNSVQPSLTPRTVSVPVTAGLPVLVQVKGMSEAPGFLGTGIYDMTVVLR